MNRSILFWFILEKYFLFTGLSPFPIFTPKQGRCKNALSCYFWPTEDQQSAHRPAEGPRRRSLPGSPRLREPAGVGTASQGVLQRPSQNNSCYEKNLPKDRMITSVVYVVITLFFSSHSKHEEVFL
ncbi:hypothetical protein HJG60_009614 [Phyllostomus discolor]|uniref:Uncharacterized protein n=1 Tax=Phyllostomus discolor TaxID=89673 RepID=A0A834DAM9_9CHIR|nr:hypothetical protein HJG60_009614 [Phyllostomus discolor]